MCQKHMYQRLLWVNTSHLMFSLKTSNTNRGHYKKECTPLLKHAVSEIMLATNVH